MDQLSIRFVTELVNAVKNAVIMELEGRNFSANRDGNLAELSPTNSSAASQGNSKKRKKKKIFYKFSISARGETVRYSGSTFELSPACVGKERVYHFAYSVPSQEHLEQASKFGLTLAGEKNLSETDIPCTNYLFSMGACLLAGDVSEHFSLPDKEHIDIWDMEAYLYILPMKGRNPNKQSIIEFIRDGRSVFFHVHMLEVLRRLDVFNKRKEQGISETLFSTVPNEDRVFNVGYPFGYGREYFFGKKNERLVRIEKDVIRGSGVTPQINYDPGKITISGAEEKENETVLPSFLLAQESVEGGSSTPRPQKRGRFGASN